MKGVNSQAARIPQSRPRGGPGAARARGVPGGRAARSGGGPEAVTEALPGRDATPAHGASARPPAGPGPGPHPV